MANWLAADLVQLVGWTIIHSLWQGAIVGFFLWLILSAVNNNRASLRHALSLGGLVLFFLSNLATLLILFSAVNPASEPASVPLTIVTPSGIGPSQEMSGWMGWKDALQDLIGAHVGMVFYIWMAGVAFFAIRLAFQLFGTYWLRVTASDACPREWVNAWNRIKIEANYMKKVGIRLSDLVDTPMVIGFLKPVVLFPVAAVNQLSLQQTEAILHHELSHLIRRDHWWNLFLALMETIYYYHPVVWLLAAQVRKEREHRCDEQVIANGVPGLLYAEALYRLQTIRQQRHRLAVGALGSNGALLDRMRRILGKTEKSDHMRQKLSSIMLIAALLIAWGITSGFAERAAAEEPNAIVAIAIDSIPPVSTGKVTIVDKDGKKTEMKLDKGVVIAAKRDGKEVPESEWPALASTLEKLAPPAPPAALTIPPPPPPLPPRPGAFAPAAPNEPMVWIFNDEEAVGEGTIDVRVDEESGKTYIRIRKENGDEEQMILEGKPGFKFMPEHEMKLFMDKELQIFPDKEMHFFPKGEMKIIHHKGDGQGIQFFTDSLEVVIRKEVDEALGREQMIIQKQRIQADDLSEISEALRIARDELDEAKYLIREEKERIGDEARRIRMEVRKELDNADEIIMFDKPGRNEVRVFKGKAEVKAGNIFEEALHKDGYIRNVNDYKLKMNENRITVNGKRITGKEYEKYKRFYEMQTGQTLPREFNITIKKDND